MTSERRYTVDIDIGGTLTDGLFGDGERVHAVKVDTTPHDFTRCFFDCLREGAERMGHADLTSFPEPEMARELLLTLARENLLELNFSGDSFTLPDDWSGIASPSRADVWA